jgi:tetratricopeptide (TPR) repeat protein
MKTLSTILIGSTIMSAIACGGGGGDTKVNTAKNTGPTTASGIAVNENAKEKFQAALDAFLAHDKAGDWNDGACAEVAKMFDNAASSQGKFPEATFDAGLAYQRCKNDQQAKDHFSRALSDDPKFHYAKVQLALYQFKADNNIDAAIGQLQQAVLDAQYQNVPALVNLALLEMQRDGTTGSNDCKDDMECAKKNLQRALAIDDAYMPALNQLALYYFAQAKKRAGAFHGRGGRSIATNAAIGRRADVQQLELAALVASQAMQKNASYAPIYNTAGLVQNELGKINLAVQFFQKAAALDPTFFEAQMNYGEVNLSFRGFQPAEGAFRKALSMRPNDYDAHLGLALALRGQITDSNYDAQVAAVQAELDACKKIDAARPDAYYNEGILTQEFRAKAGGGKDATKAALKQAITILTDFTQKASGKTEYDGAVKKAKDRIQDANDIITFLDTPDALPEPNQPKPQGGAGGTTDEKKNDTAAPPQPQGTNGTAPPAQPVPAKK